MRKKEMTAVVECCLGTWPPQEVCQLLSREIEGVVHQVLAHPAGFLTLLLKDEVEEQAFFFSRIVFDGPTNLVKLAISCGSEDPTMCINGEMVPLQDDPLKARALILPTHGVLEFRPSSLETVLPSSPVGASDVETLFIRAVHDISVAGDSDDWYTVLRTSGTLRLLLLDGMMHKANARLREEIFFETSDFSAKLPTEAPAPEIVWCCVSRDGGGPVAAIRVSLDKFLSTPVLKTSEVTASVRDVINACANALGAVHFGGPRGAKEEAVVEFDKVHVLFGSKPSLRSLQDICQVTVRALHPLVLAIQAL